MIELTPSAIAKIKLELSKRNNVNVIRIGVKGSGGCADFSYAIEYDNVVQRDNDSIFIYDENSLTVLVDAKSLILLNRMTLDYVISLKEQKFIFDNPNAKSFCGCGKSFGVK